MNIHRVYDENHYLRIEGEMETVKIILNLLKFNLDEFSLISKFSLLENVQPSYIYMQ